MGSLKRRVYSSLPEPLKPSVEKAYYRFKGITLPEEKEQEIEKNFVKSFFDNQKEYNSYKKRV